MRIAVAGATGTAGAAVVAEARKRGHDVVELTRSAGVDLVSGAGLDALLPGADAVVDLANTTTTSAAKSHAFFTAVTTGLLAAEARHAVGHHVALSIVGIDEVAAGYYAGKHAQESAVASGSVPWSLLRATQFHEFAEQSLGFARAGRVSLVPFGHLQPVAASEVATALVDLVEAGPSGRVQDLRGPRRELLVEMAKRVAARRGTGQRVIGVPMPGGYGHAMRSGVLCGNNKARTGAITFEEWLG